MTTETADRSGLSSAEAARRLAQSGPNRLFTPTPVRFWRIAAEEITEPMILLLLAVGFLYGLWGELRDALTIVAVIVVLVLVEVGNEFRAKRAIAALERIAAPKARVRRNGSVKTIDVEEVVTGDLIVLVPGTRVAADGRLALASSIAVDESALTGESLPRERAVGEPVLAGTVVVVGEGEAVVTATGSGTQLGRMGTALAGVERPKTPLQLAMKRLAGRLVWVALAFSGAIFLVGLLRGGDFRTLVLTGLSLAFATIPEELPIIIAMVLGLGSYRLSRQQFLVKRLRAAEVLGEVTVIATDKTGTLTESRMRVASAFPEQDERRTVGAALGTVSGEMPDPLEVAIVERARELGIAADEGDVLRVRHTGDGRRSKASLRRTGSGTLRLHLSGAPEEVLARCGGGSPAAHERLAAETALGRRVIAVASRPVDVSMQDAALDELEQGLDLVGLLGFADPPRRGVRETIARVASAGIRTLMVTGDHPATAAAIARDVGIPSRRVLTGDEVDLLSDAALAEAARDVSVFARTTPQQKHRVVQALQRNGEVVAVTGDGINDALALRAADVGIAMGIRGTDVAKEAAQAVLADDDYVTIARGVFEGRRFFDNLRKGVVYYLSVKIGLIATFLLPVVAGLPLPFAPIQIVVLELFMDLGASAGFVAEPAEADVQRRPPRRPGAALLDGDAVRDVFLKGLLLFAGVMIAYAYADHRGLAPAGVQTCAFAAWLAGHVMLAFVCRSDRDWAWARGLFANRVMTAWAAAAAAFLAVAISVPGVRAALRFAPVPREVLAFSIAVSVAVVSVAELAKLPAIRAARAA